MDEYGQLSLKCEDCGQLLNTLHGRETGMCFRCTQEETRKQLLARIGGQSAELDRLHATIAERDATIAKLQHAADLMDAALNERIGRCGELGRKVESRDATIAAQAERIARFGAFAEAHVVFERGCQLVPGFDWNDLGVQLSNVRRLRDEAMNAPGGAEGKG